MHLMENTLYIFVNLKGLYDVISTYLLLKA